MFVKTSSMIDTKKLEFVADILKTIAHPLRIGIVNLLTKNDRLSVNELCDLLNAEQSLMSHHLSTMKNKGVLSSDRNGKSIYYSLTLQEMVKIIECMENCEINKK